ncbi:helix-turn-helix transcriptional regulator [Aliamphritea hakodatensis]|uniref:helix-turn-helix transcriptional regulator n=1 Tax=Aliamphritea hakodatensis TaxID=2895352 RepID=UPI0022FD7AE5|nr:WYL domain-containing transcriptional regulator [Aliamphritea hakodatensis]
MESRDKLGQRLGLILTKLNSGATLYIDALAAEFNVSTRTIQRDLHQRLGYLPLTHDDGGYRLTSALGKRSNHDLRHFAQILDIDGLFPVMDDRLLGTLLDSSKTAPYLIKGMSYEDSQTFLREFNQLEAAIRQTCLIAFTYKAKSYEQVAPYRLVNYKGLWYLAAVHDDRLKSFVVAAIRGIESLKAAFNIDPIIQDEINRNTTIWYGAQSFEVIVSVEQNIASYFKRRPLLPEQKLLHELDSGGLLISSRIQHATQIIPLIKYWLPHIQVLSPIAIKKQILKDLSLSLDTFIQQDEQ